MLCKDCPRECGIDRESGERGFCGEGSAMRISRIALHPYEEPPISGENGSGTVFFCGCSLRCVFCQNREISRGGDVGAIYTPDELATAMLTLQENGATNINLVTPTHFLRKVIKTLEGVRPRLKIPVVYNTSGYEKTESLKHLDGLVDIYMPDFKYISSELSASYSNAPDYASLAENALLEMYRQVGKYEYSKNGTLARGMLVRHLVLPACRKDSIAVLKRLAELLPADKILLSLMSQYTPEFASDCQYKNLHRRLTSFEYSSVVSAAVELGFEGFMQDISSARTDYTPNFRK